MNYGRGYAASTSLADHHSAGVASSDNQSPETAKLRAGVDRNWSFDF
jgi:hypothetical protein